jgi:hypothetical protein
VRRSARDRPDRRSCEAAASLGSLPRRSRHAARFSEAARQGDRPEPAARSGQAGGVRGQARRRTPLARPPQPA